jgi:hypothetical protein
MSHPSCLSSTASLLVTPERPLLSSRNRPFVCHSTGIPLFVIRQASLCSSSRSVPCCHPQRPFVVIPQRSGGICGCPCLFLIEGIGEIDARFLEIMGYTLFAGANQPCKAARSIASLAGTDPHHSERRFCCDPRKKPAFRDCLRRTNSRTNKRVTTDHMDQNG